MIVTLAVRRRISSSTRLSPQSRRGLFWACAVARLSALVPTPLRATGQALFSAVVFAGGNTAGYFLAGVGYDHFGGVGPLFAIASTVELVPLGIALAQLRFATPAR